MMMFHPAAVRVADDLSPAEEWLALWQVPVANGVATLYKATDLLGISGREYTPVQWTVGEVVACIDWEPHPYCGNGLHLGPTMQASLSYRGGYLWSSRIFRVEVEVAKMVVVADHYLIRSDKCKVPSCRVVSEVPDFREKLDHKSSYRF